MGLASASPLEELTGVLDWIGVDDSGDVGVGLGQSLSNTGVTI